MPTCNSAETYTVIYSPTPSAAAFDNSDCSLDVSTNNSNDVGVYTITITASVSAADFGIAPGLQDSFSFDLTIIACDPTAFTFQSGIPNTEYIVGDPTETLTPALPLPTCVSLETYTATFLPTAPSLAFFDSSTCSLFVQTSTYNEIGKYTVTITASVSTSDFGVAPGISDSFTFDLVVYSTCQDWDLQID